MLYYISMKSRLWIIDDHQRNPNNNERYHLVGRQTSPLGDCEGQRVYHPGIFQGRGKQERQSSTFYFSFIWYQVPPSYEDYVKGRKSQFPKVTTITTTIIIVIIIAIICTAFKDNKSTQLDFTCILCYWICQIEIWQAWTIQFGWTNRNMAHFINTILTNTNITITPRLKTQGRDEGSQWTSSLIYLLYLIYLI